MVAKTKKPTLSLVRPEGPVSVVSAVGGGPGVMTVDVRTVVSSPRNPPARIEPGPEMDQLVGSVREVGVLQPILVVSAAAWRAAWPADELGTAEWVALAGNRRRRAAELAERFEVPVWVRDDLAADEAVTMLTENIHRLELSPIAEAQGFARLVDQGLTQTRIAQLLSVSQGHVAKRLALLKLLPTTRAAVEAGQLTLAEAAEVLALEPEVQQGVETRLDREVQSGADLPTWKLIKDASEDVVRGRNRVVAEERIAELGGEVEIADQVERGWARIYNETDEELQAAAAAKNLVVVPAGWGEGVLNWYLRKAPKREPGGAEQAEREQAERARERERKDSQKRRTEFTREKLTAIPSKAELQAGMTWFINRLTTVGTWQTQQLAHSLDKDAPEGLDAAAWAKNLKKRNPTRLAWLYVVAARELELRRTWGWSEDEVHYLEALIDEGYEPGEWETATLAEARKMMDEHEEEGL